MAAELARLGVGHDVLDPGRVAAIASEFVRSRVGRRPARHAPASREPLGQHAVHTKAR